MKKILILTFSILCAVSCKFPNDSSSSTPTTSSSDVTLTGIVSAGPVDNSHVCAYTLLDDGSQGTELACTYTDHIGNFSLGFASQTGPIEVIAYGGSYEEEATGQVVLMESDFLRLHLPSVVNGTTIIGITPLTEIAAACSAGIQTLTGTTQKVNIQNCNKALSIASGLKDITSAPANPNITLADPTSQEAKYSLLLAGISEFANQNNVASSISLLMSLRADFFTDGKFDGKNSGTPVGYNDDAGTIMHQNMWSSELASAINYFKSSSSIFSSARVPLLIWNPNITCSSEAPTKCGALCVNTNASKFHCGACGNACALANTNSSTCSSGVCAIGTCSTGYGDCNHSNPDGCEVHLTNDIANCGACGNACPMPAHSTGASCSASTCGIAACSAGYANCNGLAADGCEVNTSNDIYNCGGCGTMCALGQTCTAGSCH